jgi:hypothetical protein
MMKLLKTKVSGLKLVRTNVYKDRNGIDLIGLKKEFEK